MSALIELLRASLEGRALPPTLPAGRVRLDVLGHSDVVVSLGPSCRVSANDPSLDVDLTLWLSPQRAEALGRGEFDEPLRAAGRVELLRSLAEMMKPTTSPLGTRLG